MPFDSQAVAFSSHLPNTLLAFSVKAGGAFSWLKDCSRHMFCRLHPSSGSYWPHLLPIFCPCSPPSTLAQQGPSSYAAGPAGLAVGAQGSWQERLFLLTAGSHTRGIRGTRECQAKCPPVKQDTLPFTWAGMALKAPDGS